jgi:signal transduction histidine kinase
MSLRFRLTILWLLILVISVTLAAVMVSLSHQGTEVQLQQTADRIEGGARAVAAQVESGHGPPGAGPEVPPAERLTALLEAALLRYDGVEGGVWSQADGFLAYAFPTYPGTTAKRDVPEAEKEQIAELCRAVLRAGRPSTIRREGGNKSLILHARPLAPGDDSAAVWTMTWVVTQVASVGEQLRLGLVIVCVLAITSGVGLLWMLQHWSRRVAQVERALTSAPLETLPPIPETGERELDRIIAAVNGLNDRWRAARERSAALSHALARADHLATLGKMAAALAHEIRNPIAAMRLKAENALAQSSERRGAALEGILVQIRRLDDLLARLLAITRESESHAHVLNVRAWAAAGCEKFGECAEQAGIEFGWEAPDRDWRFDGETLERALDNLILNAFEHTPRGGRVRVSVQIEENELRLAVSDTGAGIPAAEHERIFEPFVTTRPGGTGLGLTLVREIVEAQGGTVRCTGDGRGATFEIRLPWQAS